MVNTKPAFLLRKGKEKKLRFFRAGRPHGFKETFQAVVDRLAFNDQPEFFLIGNHIDFVFSINHDCDVEAE